MPSVLWAYRTTSRVSTKETPFSLVYGAEALIPVEIGALSPRVVPLVEEENSQALREGLDLLDEHRETAAIRLASYQQRVANYYNSRVRDRLMSEGDLVLRKSQITNALKEDGKFRANWEGPYRIRCKIGPNTCALKTL